MSIAAAVVLIVQTAAAQAAPPPCATPAHAQFDFWVGDWDVYPNLKDPAKAPLLAHSKIERLYAGCAVRENWMPLKGPGGGSLNALDPVSGRWHQTWIGAQPGQVEFEGGMAGRVMVLTGFWAGVNGPGKDALIRMSYSPIDQDTVRQHGEQSVDQGLTWTTSFDFIYRRSKPAG
ncbi:hypothetical protein [Novosphingobium sp. B 225]|uniref:hypothetical protein n=1 Tax=Novosphingobium sp. B 225 TaxID=1961849 RepID=UPI000B4ABC02|nr:hypothetical protein [Novosphingobium sp. B 225]